MAGLVMSRLPARIKHIQTKSALQLLTFRAVWCLASMAPRQELVLRASGCMAPRQELVLPAPGCMAPRPELVLPAPGCIAPRQEFALPASPGIRCQKCRENVPAVSGALWAFLRETRENNRNTYGFQMSTPGVKPGLSRPQRDVLTTRRCGPLYDHALFAIVSL